MFNSLAPGGASMRQIIGESLVCPLFERQIITYRNTALMPIEPKRTHFIEISIKKKYATPFQ